MKHVFLSQSSVNFFSASMIHLVFLAFSLTSSVATPRHKSHRVLSGGSPKRQVRWNLRGHAAHFTVLPRSKTFGEVDLLPSDTKGNALESKDGRRHFIQRSFSITVIFML